MFLQLVGIWSELEKYVVSKKYHKLQEDLAVVGRAVPWQQRRRTFRTACFLYKRNPVRRGARPSRGSGSTRRTWRRSRPFGTAQIPNSSLLSANCYVALSLILKTKETIVIVILPLYSQFSILPMHGPSHIYFFRLPILFLNAGGEAMTNTFSFWVFPCTICRWNAQS